MVPLPPPPRLQPLSRTPSAYGEIITILVQVIVLVILLWVYMSPRPSPLNIAGMVTGFVAVTAACASLPMEYMVLLPLSNLPLVVMAKAPQVGRYTVVGSSSSGRGGGEQTNIYPPIFYYTADVR